jgi:sigma-B regulation protein RsbU (phosphoserine phosphatase)
MPELVYEEEKVEIAPQTTLFLYTDGLTEAENSQQEQFGKPGMEATLQQAFTGGLSDPQSLVNSLREAVKTFVGDADQSDDLTLLAISYKNHINH